MENITLSDSAAKHIASLRDRQGKPDLRLRVTVLGGGCSGFKYQLEFDDQAQGDDIVFGAGALVTDETSLPFLDGAEINYEQSLMGSRLTIKNPNAAASCGCGKSFATKM